MVVVQLEKQLRIRWPWGGRAGTQVRAAADHDGQPVEVVVRVDRKGQPVLNYFYAGARMERQTLLMLLCTEAACPQARAVQSRFRAFTGQAEPTAPVRASAGVAPPRAATLIEEVPITLAGHACVARPASFECLTPCPMRAHAPQRLRKSGWDVFEDGVWVAGGLQADGATGAPVPRFGTVDAARQWMAAQQVAARKLLGALR